MSGTFRNRLLVVGLVAVLASASGAQKPPAGSQAKGRRVISAAPTAAGSMVPSPQSGDVLFYERTTLGAQGQWWKDSKMAQQVQVSDNQIQEIEQIFREHRLRLIDLFANVQRQETMLEPLISADNPDDSLVENQIDKIAAARGELEKANARMLLSIRRVLTLEQWKKLQSLEPYGNVDFNIPVPPPTGVQPIILPK